MKVKEIPKETLIDNNLDAPTNGTSVDDFEYIQDMMLPLKRNEAILYLLALSSEDSEAHAP